MPVITPDDLKIKIPEREAKGPLLYSSEESSPSLEDNTFWRGDDSSEKYNYTRNSRRKKSAPQPPTRLASSPNQLAIHPRKSSVPEILTPPRSAHAPEVLLAREERQKSMAPLEEEEDYVDDFDLPPPNYVPESPLKPITEMKNKGKARSPRPGYISVRIRLDGARIFKLNIDSKITLSNFRNELARRIKLVTGVDVSLLVEGCALTYYDARNVSIGLSLIS
ncbi:MAG: hypothetical protein SGCHY_000303 [Lobulomycetales sp.]